MPVGCDSVALLRSFPSPNASNDAIIRGARNFPVFLSSAADRRRADPWVLGFRMSFIPIEIFLEEAFDFLCISEDSDMIFL